MRKHKKLLEFVDMVVSSNMVMEKLELVGWKEYTKLVADAYEQAPESDPEAMKSFAAMKGAVNKFFPMLQSKVKVEFVDGDPYSSAEQMRDEVKKTKVLKVMKDHSDHPYFSQEENWKFRAVHDWFTHVTAGQPFTHQGELSVYNTHTKMFPAAALPALFTEIIGQVCYVTVHGNFPPQKVCILKGFDYKNVGRVDGYVIQNKQLVKSQTPQAQDHP